MSEDENCRRFMIKNFRNIAPFRTESKGDEGAECLVLNKSLEKDKVGGIVTLIGDNNCGKSNVLDALFAYGEGSYCESDVTDFLFDEPVAPSLWMEIENGRFGDSFNHPLAEEKLESVSGRARDVVFYVLMLEWSYDSFKNYVGRQHESDLTVERWIQQAIEIHENITTSKDIVLYILSELELEMTDGTSFHDFIEEAIDENIRKGWTNEYDFPVKLVFQSPTIDYESSEEAVRIMESLTFTNKMEEEAALENEGDPGMAEFEKEYGYAISNDVICYYQEYIEKSDISCSPSEPSELITDLMEHLGFDRSALYGAYSNPILRTRLEKKVNEGLVGVSEEFNDIIGSGERRYEFSIRLEKDTIELVATYGDDIPLDIRRQSGGFQWLMDFYFNFISNNTLKPGTIVIIDDFGESLGFSAVGEVLKKLRRFSQSKGLTIVLATNNILAVDSQHLDEIRLVVRSDDGSAHIINDIDRGTCISRKIPLAFYEADIETSEDQKPIQ